MPVLGNLTHSYAPDKFIPRQPELERISGYVQQATRGERIEWPVINYWGVTGIGKTWLLKHIYHLYRYPARGQQPTLVLQYEFGNKKLAELPTIASALAKQLKKQLPLELESKKNVQQAVSQAKEGNIHALIHALDACVTNKLVPIILFDNTESITAEEWHEIEKVFIEPLVVNGRILFIVAGRRYIPRWRRFEVRRRVQDPHQTHLTPFSKESVTRLIENRHYNIDADILLPLTAGNPRLVDELGGMLQEMSQNAVVNPTFIQQYSKPIVAILHEYEKGLLKNVPEDMHSYLYAVIPLRAYRMEALRFMLKKASGDKYEMWAEGDYLRVLRELDQTEIVWWNRDRRAYTTDYIARRIINQRHLLGDPDVFVQLHQNAFSLYLGWANEHKATSEDFILEAWFHLANIWQVKPHDVEITEYFNKTIDIARQLTTDRKLVIQEQLEPHDKDTEYDSELYDLLPGDWQRQAEAIWTEMIKED